MRFRTCLKLACLSLGATLCWTPAAAAHVRLIMPEPRADGETEGDLKEGPCGQSAGMNGRTERVTTFEPGATITVSFGEFINHPGYYRIALDVDGDNDFPAATASDPDTVPVSDIANLTLPVYILQYYTDDLSPPFGQEQEYTTTVTLPAIECDNCTLQVIQFMTDNANAPYYFQCADLVLSGSGADGGVGGATASGAGGMTSGAGGAGTTGVTTGVAGASSGTTGMGGLTNTSTGAGMVTGTDAGATVSSSSASGTTSNSSTTSAGPATGTTGAALDGTASGVGGVGGSSVTPPPAAEEAGCACRTTSAGNGAGWLVALLGMALFGLRRRIGSSR